MKKIIFILALFCSFIANAQYTPPAGYTNINSRYDWLAGLFRALGLPAGGTAAFTAGQAQRAGAVYYDSTGTDAGLYIWTGGTWQSQVGPPVSGASSGILSGGVLTINADPTKFNIASGTGFIANSLAQTVIPVSWTTQTGLTVTNLLTAIATYILVDNTGAIIQQTTAPTPQQIRSHIYIGKLAHTTLTTILFAITEPSRMFDPVGQIHDLNTAIGPVNVNEGNIISANGANLNINVSAGSTYRPGANYVTARDNPSLTTESAGTAITFRRKYRNGSGGWTAVNTTLIDPDNYDDGDGTLATVPNNKFTIQTAWRFGGSGTVHIDYGQKVYNTIAEARIGISEDTRVKDPDNVRDAVLRGWIIVKQGTTALNSTTDAVFIAAGKFGESAVGTSGVSTLQSAYNNSITPQITTSTGLGSVDFKRGSAADTDPVLKIMNGAGTAVTTFSGDGATTFTGIITTPLTASRAVVTGASNELAVATTTATEIGYVNGVTSAIQAQINGRIEEAKVGADFVISNDSLKISGAVNVLDFGAVADGVTNNTTAFQNAVNTGKPVYVPPGTFLLTTSVNLKTNQTIFGKDWTSIIKITANTRALVLDSGSRVTGLKFVGNGKAGSGAFNTGVMITAAVGCSVDNCMFQDFAGNPTQNGGGGVFVAVVNTANSDGNRIANNYFFNNDGGLVFNSRGEYTTAYGNNFGGNTVAILMGAGNLTITNNVIQNNTTGIKIITGTNFAHSIVSSNLINHNTYPYWIEDVTYNLGMTFNNNMVFFGGIYISNSNNIKFSGEQWASLDSIHLDNSYYLSRTGCFVGLNIVSAPTSVSKYNGAEDFSVINETRPTAANLSFWARQIHNDTIVWNGPMYHSGVTPASSSSSDSVWVKDVSTGQYKLRAQSTLKSTLTKNINLPTPGAAENEFIFFTPVAITITNTRSVLVGSSTPSVTYNIAFGTDRTTLTNVYTAGQTVTSTTTGTDASGVNDNTIPANSWVVLTTSAQSGTVTAINTSIQFTED